MLTNLILFLTLMIPIVWSPGPNNLVCATAGGKVGVAKAIPFVIGINLPILIYALATGFGLTYILARIFHPTALNVAVLQSGWSLQPGHYG